MIHRLPPTNRTGNLRNFVMSLRTQDISLCAHFFRSYRASKVVRVPAPPTASLFSVSVPYGLAMTQVISACSTPQRLARTQSFQLAVPYRDSRRLSHVTLCSTYTTGTRDDSIIFSLQYPPGLKSFQLRVHPGDSRVLSHVSFWHPGDLVLQKDSDSRVRDSDSLTTFAELPLVFFCAFRNLRTAAVACRDDPVLHN